MMRCKPRAPAVQPESLDFNPVAEAQLAINGLSHHCMSYEQRCYLFLLEQNEQFQSWAEPALARRLAGNICNTEDAIRRNQTVLLCKERMREGIPFDSAAVQSEQFQWNLKHSFVRQNLPSGLVDNKGEVNENLLRRLLPDSIVKEWPRDSEGRLLVDIDTIGRIDHETTQLIYDYKLLRKTQAITRFTVDEDGYHRSWANPFGTRSGRDKPRGNSFIYLTKGYRYLIKPKKDHVIVLIDYQQQEPAILATLSNDQLMKKAYLGGDLYQLLGSEPEFYELTRKQLKRLLISFIYGISAYGLSRDYQITLQLAYVWLAKLEGLFASSVQWLNTYAEQAYSAGRVACLDWAMWVTAFTPFLTIRNWPVQATGADILRRACFNLSDRDIQVIGCLHDAVLINIPIDNHQNTIQEAELAMQDASEEVLGTLRLKTAIEAMYWPDSSTAEKFDHKEVSYGR